MNDHTTVISFLDNFLPSWVCCPQYGKCVNRQNVSQLLVFFLSYYSISIACFYLWYVFSRGLEGKRSDEFWSGPEYTVCLVREIVEICLHSCILLLIPAESCVLINSWCEISELVLLLCHQSQVRCPVLLMLCPVL